VSATQVDAEDRWKGAFWASSGGHPFILGSAFGVLLKLKKCDLYFELPAKAISTPFDPSEEPWLVLREHRKE
jgi:hypothetical protein